MNQIAQLDNAKTMPEIRSAIIEMIGAGVIVSMNDETEHRHNGPIRTRLTFDLIHLAGREGCEVD